MNFIKHKLKCDTRNPMAKSLPKPATLLSLQKLKGPK